MDKIRYKITGQVRRGEEGREGGFKLSRAGSRIKIHDEYSGEERK